MLRDPGPGTSGGRPTGTKPTDNFLALGAAQASWFVCGPGAPFWKPGAIIAFDSWSAGNEKTGGCLVY
ncbi:MAG TPA: hypothetical protein VGV87_12300 [Blastocatellia bacterium]|nr:hypothetical protein [Blastocatellia bacterium]